MANENVVVLRTDGTREEIPIARRDLVGDAVIVEMLAATFKEAEATMEKKLNGESVREIGTTKPIGEVKHVLGSGSVLVGFSQHDRRYVGIEHLEVYDEKSKTWVNAHDRWLARAWNKES